MRISNPRTGGTRSETDHNLYCGPAGRNTIAGGRHGCGKAETRCLDTNKEGETVFVVTDTGDAGQGKTVDAAFENLEETTAGVIFLDTADYLLIGRTAIYDAEGLARYLKPTIDVCIAGKEIDPVQAAEHLAVHHPRVELKDKNAIQRAQTLVAQNGRLVLK